jgi:uncharacterized protein YecE (DUF72 family)
MSIDPSAIRIATAGWAMPPSATPRDRLSRADTALARYARVLPATELNSSFHRHHRPSTYARWAESTPAAFRFALKLPKAITHDARLELGAALPVLDRFLGEAGELGARRGPLLVQLPPSLAFEPARVEAFLVALRERWSNGVACEPRHASWFEADADALLVAHQVARVAADPARVPAASEPGGWDGLAYVRWHGSPRTYYSSYAEQQLVGLAARLRALAAGPAEDVWCVFDNTAAGAALGNARRLQELLAT